LFKVVPAERSVIDTDDNDNVEEEQQEKFNEISELMGSSRNGSGEAIAKV
jgi:uncharacterized protein YoaH (UPF0181 family)